MLATPTPTAMIIPAGELLVESYLITLGAGIVMLIILAGVLWNSRRMKTKANK